MCVCVCVCVYRATETGKLKKIEVRMSLVLQGPLFSVTVSKAALLRGNFASAGTFHDWFGDQGNSMLCI